MTPGVIRRQVVLEEHDIAPDASVAVVARRSVDRNRYVTRLEVVELAPGRARRPRPLTSGHVRDGRPRISPDGTTIAFVRSDPADADRPSRLCLIPLAGGRIREVRRAGHGSVEEIAWSPDGTRIAFTAPVDPPRFLVGRTRPIGGPYRRPRHGVDASPLARHIERIDWRYDGVGHVDRWAHLFVTDLEGGPRPVTHGDWGVSGIAWHPDGRTIAFVADRGDDPDLRPHATIHAVDIDTADDVVEPREILVLGGPASSPAWSPDGRWIAAVGATEADPLDDVAPGLVVAPADGSGPPIRLAPELDRPIGNWADTDLNGWMTSGRHAPVWLDERTVIATVTDHGRSYPVAFGFDPPTRTPVDPPRPGPWSDTVVHSLAVARDGTISVLGTLDGRAMELMTLAAEADGAPAWRTRTRHGSAWQRRHDLPAMRRLDIPGPGGTIETWLASPRDAGDAALPTIVDVHGGPLGAWAPTPGLEVHLLVARGYRVVLPNIRGSASYGRDWIRPQLGDWGGVDAADVHAALDHVLGLGLADPARLGVLGLSYGGFMVHWLVATSDRFAAAVSENGVANQVSAWANSDSGPEYCRTSLLGDPLTADGVERLWRQSPLAHVADIHTPLLMLQGEADRRCPPGDNEQLFIALRTLRRTVEYVLYPDEYHVYASSGRPDRRIDRMTRMLDWFDRYLGR